MMGLFFQVDAIVNTTSKDLNLNNGAVSQAILQAAGPSIQVGQSVSLFSGFFTLCHSKKVKLRIMQNPQPFQGYHETPTVISEYIKLLKKHFVTFIFALVSLSFDVSLLHMMGIYHTVVTLLSSPVPLIHVGI